MRFTVGLKTQGRSDHIVLDAEDALVLRRGVLGANEREHLHLVELVHSEEPARVLAGGPRLAPEAGGDSRVAAWQLVEGEDLVGVQRRQRHL